MQTAKWQQRWQAAVVTAILVTATFGSGMSAQAALTLLNPKLSGTLQANGDVNVYYDFKISPNGQRVVYLADAETDDAEQLYSAPTDGSAPPVRLGVLLPQGTSVKDFKISPDSSRIVYKVVQNSAGVSELFVAYEPPPGATLIGPTAPVGVGSVTLMVTLNKVTTLAAASVTLVATGGSATAGTDYTFAPVTLRFVPGETTKTVTLTVLANPVRTTRKTIILSLGGTTTTILGNPSTLTLMLAGTLQEPTPPVQHSLYVPRTLR